MQAKGETSTIQTGKDTNIMQKIFQSSWFNDKNASKNKEYFYSRFQLYARAHVRICEKMLQSSSLFSSSYLSLHLVQHIHPKLELL